MFHPCFIHVLSISALLKPKKTKKITGEFRTGSSEVREMVGFSPNQQTGGSEAVEDAKIIHLMGKPVG